MRQRFFLIGLGHTTALQTESDVLRNGHIWIERIGLKHHCNIAIPRVQSVYNTVANGNFTTVNALKARDHVQQGGLAAAGWPQQDQKITISKVNIDPVQDVIPTQFFADVGNSKSRRSFILSRNQRSDRG